MILIGAVIYIYQMVLNRCGNLKKKKIFCSQHAKQFDARQLATMQRTRKEWRKQNYIAADGKRYHILLVSAVKCIRINHLAHWQQFRTVWTKAAEPTTNKRKTIQPEWIEREDKCMCNMSKLPNYSCTNFTWMVNVIGYFLSPALWLIIMRCMLSTRLKHIFSVLWLCLFVSWCVLCFFREFLV